MILFSAADLLWATRIKAAAEDLGLAARPVRNLEMLSERLGEGPVAALIVDLDQGEFGLDLIRAAVQADGQTRPGTILAFGPHVATDLFEAAGEAGADKILARGAFSSNLPELLQALAGVGGLSPEMSGASGGFICSGTFRGCSEALLLRAIDAGPSFPAWCGGGQRNIPTAPWGPVSSFS